MQILLGFSLVAIGKKKSRNINGHLLWASTYFLYSTELSSVMFLVVWKYIEKNIWSDKADFVLYS